MKHVSISEIDGITVVRPRGLFGRLLGGEETDALDAVLRKLDEAGAQRVIVDLGSINFMSTLPITVLLRAHKHFVERGARIALCNLAAHIREVFVIIKLSLVFEVHETLRDAVEALRRVRDREKVLAGEPEAREPDVAPAAQEGEGR